MKALWWLLPAVPLLLLLGALLLNRAPLLQEPGPWARLKVYLGSNVAQTQVAHAHPELRPRQFPLAPGELLDRVAAAMRELGWQRIRVEGERVHAEVVTPLLRFTDDVQAWVEAAPGGSVLHLRSASRLGKADFAANQRHLQQLLEALRKDSVL